MPAEGDPRINVVHVGKFYPPHVGGMESHLETLCRELRKTMNVRALVANDVRRDEDSIVDGVRVSRLATHFNLAGAPVCATMPWKVRGAAADIVHVHVPNPTGVLAVMASGYKGKIVVTWHSDVVRQRRLAQIFAPIQRRFLSRCSAIIASSPNYLETSPDLADFRSRCHVIPFGIDFDHFRRVDELAVKAIHDRYPGPLLLAVGRMVYYKGFEFLIRAMKQIDAKLLLIGDGPLRASLEREARAAGGGGPSDFPGHAARRHPLLPRLRCFCDFVGYSQRSLRNRAARSDGLRQAGRKHGHRFGRAVRVIGRSDRYHGGAWRRRRAAPFDKSIARRRQS